MTARFSRKRHGVFAAVVLVRFDPIGGMLRRTRENLNRRNPDEEEGEGEEEKEKFRY